MDTADKALTRGRGILGENPAQSQVRGGQIADHFQEVQGQCAGHERMDQGSSESETASPTRHAQTQITGLLELLRCPRQLLDDGKVRSGGQISPLQMAQPSQPAPVLHLESVPQPSAFLETASTAYRLTLLSIALALANHSSLKCLSDPCPTLYLRVHPRSPVR